ncbi:ejaculatory bulb-specific protein 3-like [Agrilus planipennis]|uniref:Ejaculatory bulb-specific protein 3-like n=1 Tax=Agrilus planipennis TaxID=224129 RepID=A0A7F5R0F7_AGRPL|nr:ejaculatory bulb-specific protein 3-like [Agrilus planipennis]
MYKANVSFICAIAAFILFIDHQKTIGAVAVERVKRADGEKYTTKYDNIDIDRILTNERLFKNYKNCILDKGKCTPDGQELKSKFI